MNEKNLLKIVFTVGHELADECELFLAAKTPHGWEESRSAEAVTYTFYLENHPLGMEIVKQVRERFPASDVRFEEQASENWAMAWKDNFNPVTCGERFEILPPWMEAEGNELTPIIIEPKMAFGTGHHPTTALCLEVMAELARDGALGPKMDFFDLGTGSGILGIGLCKLGLSGIGVDIDPQAVVCARENLEINKVDDSMTLAVGSVDCLDPERRFDVVVANILSGPLIEMAAPIIDRVKPGGTLILSGILREQAEAVSAAYMRQGLPGPVMESQGEWVVIFWKDVRRDS